MSDVWEARLQELKDFKEEHGHCNVSYKQGGPGGLGKWVQHQRRCQKYNLTSMDSSHIQKLNDIGFQWSVRDVKWDAQFQELKEFKKQHGHCNVPATHRLGKWVQEQRRNRKGRKGRRSLDPCRIRQLEEEGFQWQLFSRLDREKGADKPADVDRLETRFQELKDFKEEHGHCDVPLEHPGGLGTWIKSQRRDVLRRLEEEGFKFQIGQDGQGSKAAASTKSGGKEDPDGPADSDKAPTNWGAKGALSDKGRRIVSENSAQVSDNMIKMYREGHAVGQETARVKYEDRLKVLQEKMEGLQESILRLERENNGHKARIGALQDELCLLQKDEKSVNEKSA